MDDKKGLYPISSTGLLDALDVAACITGRDGIILFANRAMALLTGADAASLRGREAVWNTTQSGIVIAGIKERASSRVWSDVLQNWYDLEIIPLGGLGNTLLWKAVPVPADQPAAGSGKPEELRDLYLTLFKTSPSGISLLDEQGQILDINEAYCITTQYSRQELIGKSILLMVRPHNHEKALDNIRRILSGEVLTHEVTSLRKDGSVYYSHLTESAVILPGGKKGILSVSNDITERKLAEMAVIKSEEKFRNIANYTANWESLLDTEGRMLWTNPAAERFTGYTPDELISEPEVVLSIIDKTSISDSKALFGEIRSAHSGKDKIFRFKRKDGTLFWISLSWNHILDKNGNTTGIRTSGQDVTQRMKALEALELSEKLHRQMIENSPVGMHFFELDDRDRLIFTGANPAADKILHTDNSKYIGMEFMEAFPGRNDSGTLEHYRKAARENISWVSEQVNYKDDIISGTYEIRAYQSTPGKMVAMFTDITNRKKTELELIESRNLFEALTRMAPVGIFRADPEGNTTFVNPKWTALTGLSAEEALENKYMRAIHPDDRRERDKEWKLAIEKQIPVSSEYRFVKPDGTVIWVHGQAVPEVVEGRFIGFIGTITDITELIDIQHELIRAKENAEASNRLKTTFMKNISHEVRTPLNGILGFAQLIASGEYSESENMEFIVLLENSIGRLTKTIDNIMDLSMLMSGNMVKNNMAFRVNDLVNEVSRPFIARAKKKELEFTLDEVNSSTNDLIIADKRIIRRIIEECLDNALKFTGSGHIRLTCGISDATLRISVSDTGIGISEEYQPLIFEPFMQENVYTTRWQNSTGMGLAIVQGSVGLLGGSIHVSSSPGKGTVVTCEIPVKRIKPGESVPAVETDSTSENPPLLLIVENEEINRLFLKKLLSRHTDRLLLAGSGAESVEMVKNHPDIDAILMDIRMPGMDGLEAVKQIRQITPGMKILAVTAYGSTGDREACLESGCDEYIAKPFHSNELLALLRKMTGRSMV
jgi:PAS domain S-box-containing protein